MVSTDTTNLAYLVDRTEQFDAAAFVIELESGPAVGFNYLSDMK